MYFNAQNFAVGFTFLLNNLFTKCYYSLTSCVSLLPPPSTMKHSKLPLNLSSSILKFGLQFQNINLSWWGAWRQAGRHGTGEAGESLHLISKHEAKKGDVLCWAFEISEPTLSDTPTPTRPRLVFLPKQLHQCWGHEDPCTRRAIGKRDYSTFRGLSSKKGIPVFCPDDWKWILLTTWQPFCYVWRQNSSTFCYRDRCHPSSPEWLPQTLPSLDP